MQEEQEMATETVVLLGGKGKLEWEREDGVTVCFDWDVEGHDLIPDRDLQVMVPTNWTQVLTLESAFVWDEAADDDREMTPDELLTWGQAHAQELLDHASDLACDAAERWAEDHVR